MKLALGTAQFGLDYGITNSGGQVQIDEVRKILNLAKNNNINTLDTAPEYGNSEQVLGDVNTCDFKIVTKTRNFNQAVIGNKEINLLTSDFKKSLKLLKQKSVYSVLVHNANDLLKPGADKIIKQLQILKQKGLLTKIGVSIYSDNQVQQIIDGFDIDLSTCQRMGI